MVSAQATEITPGDLVRQDGALETLQVLDVREPHEFQRGHLPHALAIPLGELSGRLTELDPLRPTLVYCKGGVRSAKAIAELRKLGYQGHLLNLRGGISAWTGPLAA